MKMEPMVSLGDPVYSRVTDQLRIAIISGEFEPGQRLKMDGLIQRFGTSKIPIREALQLLQGEGLITILPHRGAQVRSVDRRFISNLYDIRIAIGSLLVRKTCEQKNLDWIDELKKAQDFYELIVKKGDITEIIEANHRFHRIHNLVADNEEAINILKRTETLITVLRTTHGYQKERILQVCKEHREIIKCFEKRDLNDALSVHVTHCENAKSTMLWQIPEK